MSLSSFPTKIYGDGHVSALYMKKCVSKEYTMGHAKNKAVSMKVVDPNVEPLRMIDQVTFHRGSENYVDITFCTATPMVSEGSEFSYEAVVAARLRFDVRLAKAIVDGLSRQIAMAGDAHLSNDKSPVSVVGRVVN